MLTTKNLRVIGGAGLTPSGVQTFASPSPRSRGTGSKTRGVLPFLLLWIVPGLRDRLQVVLIPEEPRVAPMGTDVVGGRMLAHQDHPGLLALGPEQGRSKKQDKPWYQVSERNPCETQARQVGCCGWRRLSSRRRLQWANSISGLFLLPLRAI